MFEMLSQLLRELPHHGLHHQAAAPHRDTVVVGVRGPEFSSYNLHKFCLELVLERADALGVDHHLSVRVRIRIRVQVSVRFGIRIWVRVRVGGRARANVKTGVRVRVRVNVTVKVRVKVRLKVNTFAHSSEDISLTKVKHSVGRWSQY